MKDPKQDPDPGPKHPLKSDPDPDPDPKKIIPDPKPCHYYDWYQCSRSVSFFYFGSGSLSTCMDPSINKNKKIMKNLDFYGFETYFKTDVNVPTVRNKQKNLEKKIIFCWYLDSHWRKEQNPDPDSVQDL
jgi:hypothetical protein